MIALIVGLLTGILSGFGIGGGTLLMLYLTVFAGVAQKTAQGINLLYFLPTAFASLLLHSKNHTLNWKAALPAVLGGCLTAGLFSYVAAGMDLSLLRKLFGGFLLLTGLSELLRKPS
jgi:uncharacterized membrane protein YfcA